MRRIPLAVATAATFACALTAPGPAVAATAPPAQQHAATATGSAHKLPDGWRRCNNTHHRFSIGYPRDWHTSQLRPADKCRQFDRQPFTVPEASEYPITALNAVATTAVFSELVQSPGDPMFEERLLWQQTSVCGRRALRYETVATGEGLYQKGTRTYGYAVNRSGKAFLVFTMTPPATTGTRGTRSSWTARSARCGSGNQPSAAPVLGGIRLNEQPNSSASVGARRHCTAVAELWHCGRSARSPHWVPARDSRRGYGGLAWN